LEIVEQALKGFGGTGEVAQFGFNLGRGVLFHNLEQVSGLGTANEKGRLLGN